LRQLDIEVAVLLNGTEQGLRHVVEERQLRFQMGSGGWGDGLGKWVHVLASIKIKWLRGSSRFVSIRPRRRVCSANAKATSPQRASYDLDQTYTSPWQPKNTRFFGTG
jgi:hypothetical protein